jgi:hypothetical protein
MGTAPPTGFTRADNRRPHQPETTRAASTPAHGGDLWRGTRRRASGEQHPFSPTGSWVPLWGSAQALSHVCSHAHPHTHRRRRWIRGSSTRFLLALSEACCSQSLPRLEELVDQELFERQSAAPALPVNPELEKLVPF